MRQLNSAESTRSAFSFSTCSWNTRMWSMNATTRSAACIGLACRPAAASRGATCRDSLSHRASTSQQRSHVQRQFSTPIVYLTAEEPRGGTVYHTERLLHSRGATWSDSLAHRASTSQQRSHVERQFITPSVYFTAEEPRGVTVYHTERPPHSRGATWSDSLSYRASTSQQRSHVQRQFITPSVYFTAEEPRAETV